MTHSAFAIPQAIAVSFLLYLFLFVTSSSLASEYPQEEYSYVTHNASYGSAFFYALKGNPDAETRRGQPLVMWLQGGPGASSLYSDLVETGPQMIVDTEEAPGYALRPRPHAWTQHATMLYVDNPIGTGFSYTRDPRGFSTTDEEIAEALLDFLGKFLEKHTEYINNDFWIFCESYGGKMTAYFAAALADALQSNRFPFPALNFKGVEIGDGWISPIDCMYSYGSYLSSLAQVSQAQAANVMGFAKQAQSALEQYNGVQATAWWGSQQSAISEYTSNVNWYNILYYYDYLPDDAMTAYVTQNLTTQLKLVGIVPNDVSFNSQSGEVFEKLRGTFMRNGLAQVSRLLQLGYAVHVVSGQLDLIVNTLCADAWVSRLDWSDLPEFNKQQRFPIRLSNSTDIGGFVQNYKNLFVWTINNAGHMVPADNPSAAEWMMASIVGSQKGRSNGFHLPLRFTRQSKRSRRRKLYKP